MKLNNFKLNLTDLAGIGTWAVIFFLSLYLLQNYPAEIQANTWLIVSFFIGYLFCFLLITREGLFADSRRLYLSLLSAQLLFAFLIMWFLPVIFLSILTVIWVAILPHFFSLRRSILITLLVVISWYVIYGTHWQAKHVFIQGLLFLTFHIFSVLMTHHTKLAEDATSEAQRLNKELQATQHLLAEASRQNERTRIARDLHDLLGHHLTALIINLQVAAHITQGEAKDKVDQCHALAKLLLSDVREAVSVIRENRSLDFRKMVELMIDHIPKLKIHVNMDTGLNLDDLKLAKTLLSCIQEALTNSLRHSGADEFWLSMTHQQHALVLELHDNGRVSDKLIRGNGLKGMQERIEEFEGELRIEQVNHALQIKISIPLSKVSTED